ncbi:MAG: FAD-dependent thymidylate synthase [Candidatus Lokiarchaeota archaeon]|nr:FAD-dependent thymidylate synthase [Candidatus Lokiarchaeota archaeon]
MKIVLLNLSHNSEKLIEIAGRTSYLSFDKQMPGSEKKFIRMIIKNGHESVLEHASATFWVYEISRVLSHQFVRHRFCSITQQSQRYIDEKNFKYIEPFSVSTNSEAHKIYVNLMKDIEKSYQKLRDIGIKKEDTRYILPNSTTTQMVITANLREWRHIIKIRGEKAAQWEIRKLVIEILKIFKNEIPIVFSDFIIDDDNLVISKNPS